MPVSSHLSVGLAAISKAADMDLITAALCRGLLIGYEKRWGVPTWAVEGVEQLVEAPLPGTDFVLVGKLDLAFAFQRGDGGRVLCDHKTTGSPINDAGDHYWEHLTIDTQISHYMLMARMLGRPFAQVLWDVTRRPLIRPRRISEIDAERLAIEGTYYGIKVPEAAARKGAATKREDAALLEVRMAVDCTVERPEHYFARGDVFRTDEELDEYESELRFYLLSMKRVQACKANYELPVSRNPGSCRMFNRPCEFMGLCAGTDTIDSRNWMRKARAHPELEQLDPRLDTYKAASNSSLSVFRACPRKHDYQYVERIEPANARPDEILAFGTIWHAGLEAYLKSIQAEQQQAALKEAA